jgi:hypothetical protein
MRLALICLLALTAGSATAQTGNQPGRISAPPPAIGVPPSWHPFLPGETPTMARNRMERQQKGWAFLNANATSIDDVKALAGKCRKSTTVPDYCSIPEIRRIGRSY